MVAKNGDNVKVHYTGTLKNGEIFDSSREREPLQFIIGERKLIALFEETVIGMAVGETKKVSILAADAYGEINQELIAQVQKSQLPPDLNPQKGQHLQVSQPDGQVIPIVVTEVSENTITIDANHPLAGQDLTFAIELVEIL